MPDIPGLRARARDLFGFSGAPAPENPNKSGLARARGHPAACGADPAHDTPQVKKDAAIEADIAHGLPATILVGLPDTALCEARDWIRAAIVNTGERWPATKITVGLSPASLPKRGSGFDPAIAVAIMEAELVSGIRARRNIRRSVRVMSGSNGRREPIGEPLLRQWPSPWPLPHSGPPLRGTRISATVTTRTSGKRLRRRSLNLFGEQCRVSSGRPWRASSVRCHPSPK
jgi:hypothetical protein